MEETDPSLGGVVPLVKRDAFQACGLKLEWIWHQEPLWDGEFQCHVKWYYKKGESLICTQYSIIKRKKAEVQWFLCPVKPEEAAVGSRDGGESDWYGKDMRSLSVWWRRPGGAMKLEGEGFKISPKGNYRVVEKFSKTWHQERMRVTINKGPVI